MKAYVKDLGRVSLVPKGEHNSSNEYERLDLVYDRNTKIAYVAKKDVPKSTDISDTTYWQIISIAVNNLDDLNKLIAITNNEIDNIVK